MTQYNEEKRSSCCRLQTEKVDKICAFFGELAATAVLMFLGCLGCIRTDIFVNSDWQMGLNFGLVVMIAIQCYGCVSGAHINPAVTLAALIYRTITWPMALVYFVAQLLGSFIGYGLLRAVMPVSTWRSDENTAGVCVTSVAGELNALQGLLIEFLITSVLIMFCCGTWDPRNARVQDSAPLRFGLAVSCLSVAAGRFTGASMNPIRSLGPAVWNNSYRDHWIYWVGPLAAAAITAFVYKTVFRREVQEFTPAEKRHSLDEA